MLPSLTLTSTIPARLPTGGLPTVAVRSDVTEKSASMQKADEIIKKFENRVKEGSLAKFEQAIKELYTNGSNLQEQHELCRQIASLITEESEVSVQEAGGIYLGYKVSVVSKAGGEPEEIFNAAEIYRQTKEYSPPESLQTTQFGSGRSQSLHKRKLEGKASDVTSSVRSPESSSKRIPFSEYVLSTQSKDASKIELPSDTIESTTSIVTSPATQMKSATTSGTKDVATTSSVVSSTSQTKPLTGIGTKDEVTTDPGISTPPLPKKQNSTNS